ncbi:MAG: ATP-binding protein [Actinomycetaceae bacterium]|nr:ATP-binding protein [Actinomycetaceae bacterium]
MFTPIHRALGAEPSEVNKELLKKAVEQSVRESSDLDWKKSFYHSSKQGWMDEAAKDLAAMANSGGGWIVFGVQEDQYSESAAEITPIRWSKVEQQKLLQVSYARVSPGLVGIEFTEVEFEEGSVVLVRVPDSPDAPHFARKGDNAFTAPRRNGPHTVYMSEREIERGFRERFQKRDFREEHIQEHLQHA